MSYGKEATWAIDIYSPYAIYIIYTDYMTIIHIHIHIYMIYIDVISI